MTAQKQNRSKRPALLICDDDSTFKSAVKVLVGNQMDCYLAPHSDEAAKILKAHSIDIILLDIQMRTNDEGLRAIPIFKEIDPEISIIMSSGLTDFASVREAMRLGAVDYVPKAFNPDELLVALEAALKHRELIQHSARQTAETKRESKQHVLLGKSTAIEQLRRTIARLQEGNANILITGETGTGKEVVARLLRAPLEDGIPQPFVAVDSATIQGSMAEGLLFGYEKGAFTGADKMTKGLFEEADGGIIYFDEIVNMPLEIQAKLLRVLQEKEVRRLGSNKVLQLEFRVVAATNRNLDQRVSEGQFMGDLLQRLNVIPLELPPLRDRLEDLELLIQHFLARQGYSHFKMTDDALEALRSYNWPGNVRELGNLVSFLTNLCDGPEIDLADLPPKFRDQILDAQVKQSGAKPKSSDDSKSKNVQSFYDQIADHERQILNQAYLNHDGNIRKLALVLGMDRSHLYSKLKLHGIYPEKS